MVEHLFGRRKKRRKAAAAGTGKPLTGPPGFLLAPLIIFKPLMKKMVRRKGKAPQRKLKPLARQFFELYVKKSGNFEEDLASELFN